MQLHQINGYFWSAYDGFVFNRLWLGVNGRGEGGLQTELVHHIDVWRMDDDTVLQLYPWKDERKQEVSLGYQVITWNESLVQFSSPDPPSSTSVA
jgi:hypothetical protein